MRDYSQLNINLEPAERTLREAFGQKLKVLGQKNPAIIALDADVATPSQTQLFGDAFPDRFFPVGIAEQDMIGIANGFAVSGKIPVVGGLTCFTIGRAWEIIHTAAYDHLPLKLCTINAGFNNSRDGGSHHALEDIALMASLSGVQIFCPCDPLEVDQMLPYIIEQPGVCYLRMQREVMPWVWSRDSGYQFEPNRPDLIYESNDGPVQITIFSMGSMTPYAPQIIAALEETNISVRFVHFGTIKPLNASIIADFCQNTTRLVTLEEHNVIAGFGAQICRLVSKTRPVPTLTIGVNEQFGQSGSVEELFDAYGLSPPKIISAIEEFIRSQ